MPNLLHLVYEYRRLVARRDLMQGQMGRRTQARLEALEKLFGRDPDDTDPAITPGQRRRRYARAEVSVPATIKMGRRVQAVNVVNLGGGGVCVTPAPPLREGERAVIRIVADDRDSVYHYPVEAKWVRRDPDTSEMGMPFIGAPRQLPLAG